MKFRYTRFEKIYRNRDEAIKKLNGTSRYYAENVAIRYTGANRVETMLAIYNSENKGDYHINFDSGSGSSGSGSGGGSGRIFDMTRKLGESDREVLDRALFDYGEPQEWDLVIIHSVGEGDVSYLHHSGTWICLTQNLVLTPKDSPTVHLTVTRDLELGAYFIQAEVPIDESSLVLSEDGKLQVGTIDCGKLSDYE